MGQRGRPPHPDILTPRQWEVLDLVRDGLSDQQIADRLDITLAGAKYHVSEILTKLGVSSREEAAAWQPPAEPTRPWWQRAIALSLVWKAACVAVVAAAAVGIGVLAWGVAKTGSDEAEASVFEDLQLPPPGTPPTKTRDELLMGYVIGGGIRAIDIQVSTVEGIYRQFGRRNSGWQRHNGFPNAADDQSTVWLVRTRSPVNQCKTRRLVCRGIPTPSLIDCRGGVIAILDSDRGDLPGSFTWAATDRDSSEPDADCNGPISRDVAIIHARQALNLVVPDDKGAQVDARRTTLRDGLEAIRSAGFSPGNISGDIGSSVWLATFQGHYYAPVHGAVSPTPASPTPTIAPPCHVVAAIIDESGTILFADSAPFNACG
jgi:DNA-binding CsgD family transcriptional regulator